MMKLKLKGGNSPKIKVPKIEIKECKGKTKDEKKLENEMFEQAREAKLLLEQLLNEDRYGEFKRTRSNSFNATVENLLLSNKHVEKPKNLNKARSSVPNIHNLPRRLLARHKQQQNPRSSPTSPLSPKRLKKSPFKFINGFILNMEQAMTESSGDESDCWLPQTKKVVDSTPMTEDMTAECKSFKALDINE